MNILAVRKRRLLTELKRSSGCGPVRCHFCRDCPHPEGHCDRRYGTLSRPAHTHRRSKQLILLIFLGCFALVVAVWHLNQLNLDADYWVFARARCASRIWAGISHRPNYPGCLMHAGYSAIETANGAEAQLYSALNQQASLLSHFDCFTGLIVPAFASLVLALTIKNFQPPGKPTGAH